MIRQCVLGNTLGLLWSLRLLSWVKGCVWRTEVTRLRAFRRVEDGCGGPYCDRDFSPAITREMWSKRSGFSLLRAGQISFDRTEHLEKIFMAVKKRYGGTWVRVSQSGIRIIPSQKLCLVCPRSLIWLALGSPLYWLNVVTWVTVFVGLKDHQVSLPNQVRMRAVVRGWERFVSNTNYVWSCVSCSVSPAVWAVKS